MRRDRIDTLITRRLRNEAYTVGLRRLLWEWHPTTRFRDDAFVTSEASGMYEWVAEEVMR